MRRWTSRWRAAGRFAAAAWSSPGARRADAEPESDSPPVLPPRLPAAPAAAPPGRPPLGPTHQKLTLYAGGALVVLIVLVIVLLSPRRPSATLAPEGQTVVQVVDVRRFLRSPVYRMLIAANHPLIRTMERREQRHNISLERDVTTLVDTDDTTILVGRFSPDRLRDGFEEGIEAAEKEINRARQKTVQLQIQRADAEGYPYLFCTQEGVDRAFTAIGTTIACFGDRWGVRRFLKARAGVRGHALEDPQFAAAYSAPLVRGAFLHRLEKPGGKLVASSLKDLLGPAGEGVQATFFALGTSGRAIGLTVRFAARDAQAGEKLETRLTTATAQAALRDLLGPAAVVRVTRADRIVVLECAIPLEGFDEIVERHKNGQAHNLVLELIAS